MMVIESQLITSELIASELLASKLKKNEGIASKADGK